MNGISATIASIVTLYLKISDGQIDFSQVPTFVFWLKIGPTVIPLLLIFLIILLALPFSSRSSRTGITHIPYGSAGSPENGYIADNSLQRPDRPGPVEIMTPKNKGCCYCCFGKRKKPTTIVLRDVTSNNNANNIAENNSNLDHGSVIDSDLEDDGLIVVYNQAADNSSTGTKHGRDDAGSTSDRPATDSPSLILGSLSPRPQKPLRYQYKSNTDSSEPGHVYDPAADSSKYNTTNEMVMTSFGSVHPAGKPPILEEPELDLKLAQRCPSSSAISSSTSHESHGSHQSHVSSDTPEPETDHDRDNVDYNQLPDMTDEPLPLGSLIIANQIAVKPVHSTPPPIPKKPSFTMAYRPPPSSSIMPASTSAESTTTKAHSSDSTTSDGESGVSLNCDEGATTDSQSVVSFAPESDLSRSLKRNARLRDCIKDNDLEVIDEFSHTMERLKAALKEEEARLLEESFSRIEQIVAGPAERTAKSSLGVGVGSHAHLDSIMSDLESVIEDIDTWE